MTRTVLGLPKPMRVLCYALIESSLGDAARKTFAMLPQGQRFFSETQRRWFAEGEAKGETEGKAQATHQELDHVLRRVHRRTVAWLARKRYLGGAPDGGSQETTAQTSIDACAAIAM
jgi:hypothetical protein